MREKTSDKRTFFKNRGARGVKKSISKFVTIASCNIDPQGTIQRVVFTGG